MAYTTTTPAKKPDQAYMGAEQAARQGATTQGLRDASLGLPAINLQAVPGFNARSADADAQAIWDAAQARVMGAAHQDLGNQAYRWSQWWNEGETPGTAGTYVPQEQLIADYLGALSQAGAQRDADRRAEYAQAMAGRGRGGGGGGGRGRRGRGGGGGGGGAVMSGGAASPGITDAELDAWVRALTPPSPTPRFASGMGGAPTFLPSERPAGRPRNQARAV